LAPQKKKQEAPKRDDIIESSIIDDLTDSAGQNDHFFKKVKKNLAGESSSIATEIYGMSKSENAGIGRFNN